MHKVEWEKHADGTFTAHRASLFLKVRRQADCPYTRFLVQMPQPNGVSALVGSGTEMNAWDGMRAAEKMAERFVGRPRVSKPVVMLVASSAPVRATLSTALRRNGYKVSDAVSGEGALRRLERTTEPVVVVADIDLESGMGGLEFAHVVRSLWPSTALLLLTGETAPLSGEVACDGFLTKPFSVGQFLESVAAIANG